nr:MAG TPA: hypothetical protein [Caudoviricetes sp.]
MTLMLKPTNKKVLKTILVCCRAQLTMLLQILKIFRTLGLRMTCYRR